MRESGSALPGHARVLALRALPYLEVARRCSWDGDGAGALTLKAEYEGAVTLCDETGAPREIRFKADRVDRVGETLRFTDYKTGTPLAKQIRQASRSRRLAELVARGQALQTMVYTRAGGPQAIGRYLFLRPDLAEAQRILDAAATGELAEPFERAVQTVLAAWDAGSFPPRLRQHDRDEEPSACRGCDVKQACLRGDSGARVRVARWMERLSTEPSGDAAEARAARIWQLAGAQP
jgi:hypothetical protein